MKNILFFILLLVLYSCSVPIDEIKVSNSDIVVEGWIDKDSVAEVIVSHSILGTERSESSIDSIIILDADVLLSDGTQSEKLTCTKSDIYPYLLYKGEKIKGMSGKTYSLSVSKNDIKASSNCYMYDDMLIDSVLCKNVGESNQSISVYFTDNNYANRYYLLLVKLIGSDYRFYPAIMGYVNGTQCISPIIRVGLLKSIRNVTNQNENFEFNEGDSLSIRLTEIDEKNYCFWKSFFTATINKSDPLFPTNINIESTMTGAMGVWSCYSGKEFNIKVKNGKTM